MFLVGLDCTWIFCTAFALSQLGYFFMKGKGGKVKGKNFSSSSSPNSPIMWTWKGAQKGQFRRSSFS